MIAKYARSFRIAAMNARTSTPNAAYGRSAAVKTTIMPIIETPACVRATSAIATRFTIGKISKKWRRRRMGSRAQRLIVGPVSLCAYEPVRLGCVGGRRVRRHRQKEERDRDQRVHRQKLHAFVPVRFAVETEIGEHRHAEGDGEDLEWREEEIHRMTHRVGEKHEQRRDEERDLNARLHRDVERGVHLI